MADISDTLAALDKAATPGTLVHNGWGDGSTQMGMTNVFNEDAEVLLAECVPEADAAFLVALWNAYRTGQLVPVPSVERVARAIGRANAEQLVRRDPRLTDEERSDIVECQVHNGWDLWVPEASAVIAAMQERQAA